MIFDDPAAHHSLQQEELRQVQAQEQRKGQRQAHEGAFRPDGPESQTTFTPFADIRLNSVPYPCKKSRQFASSASLLVGRILDSFNTGYERDIVL